MRTGHGRFEALKQRTLLTVAFPVDANVIDVASLYGAVPNGYRNSVSGGRTFLEDIVRTDFVFRGQQIWAWQLNSEGNDGKPNCCLHRSRSQSHPVEEPLVPLKPSPAFPELPRDRNLWGRA